jgi:uncharacterized membrane protein YraQ (UPF0718 family)
MSEEFRIKMTAIRVVAGLCAALMASIVVSQWHNTEADVRVAHEKAAQYVADADGTKAGRDKAMFEFMLREEQNRSPEWLKKNCEEKKP